jgi:hypothetical protein
MLTDSPLLWNLLGSACRAVTPGRCRAPKRPWPTPTRLPNADWLMPIALCSIEEPAKHTVANEVMVTTNVYDHAERLRSYELLAEVFIQTPGK